MSEAQTINLNQNTYQELNNALRAGSGGALRLNLEHNVDLLRNNGVPSAK